jgi:hypothetical protein
MSKHEYAFQVKLCGSASHSIEVRARRIEKRPKDETDWVASRARSEVREERVTAAHLVREYAFDVMLLAVARVKAPDLEAARDALVNICEVDLTGVDVSPNRPNPTRAIEIRLTEASIDTLAELDEIKPFQVDGEDVDEDQEPCRKCGAYPGTSEYGTLGDGFDGLCPSCADKAEAARGG